MTIVLDIMDDVIYIDPLATAAEADETPPVVTVVSPTADTAIADDAIVIVDITDEDELKDVVVSVEIAGRWETVYFGSDNNFAPGYSLSTSSAITDGIRLSIRRNGGWTSKPTFMLKAWDGAGNQSQ